MWNIILAQWLNSSCYTTEHICTEIMERGPMDQPPHTTLELLCLPSGILPYIPFHSSRHSVHKNNGGDNKHLGVADTGQRVLGGYSSRHRGGSLEHCHLHHSLDFFLQPQ
jgi:hypothetical protein